LSAGRRPLAIYRSCRAAQTSSQKKHGRAAARPYQKTLNKTALAKELFALSELAQAHGWSAEELLSAETKRREHQFRKEEQRKLQA
jgi:hypothetical protein